MAYRHERRQNDSNRLSLRERLEPVTQELRSKLGDLGGRKHIGAIRERVIKLRDQGRRFFKVGSG